MRLNLSKSCSFALWPSSACMALQDEVSWLLNVVYPPSSVRAAAALAVDHDTPGSRRLSLFAMLLAGRPAAVLLFFDSCVQFSCILILSFSGHRVYFLFSCRKGRADRYPQNMPPDLLHKFLPISTFQVVLTGLGLKILFEIFALHSFLSSTSFCFVKLKNKPNVKPSNS